MPRFRYRTGMLAAVKGAIKDVVSQYWNLDKTSATDAMARIAAATKIK